MYLVRGGTDGKEYPIQLHSDGMWEWLPFPCLFGPRIPSAEELAGLYAAEKKLAEAREGITFWSYCMNQGMRKTCPEREEELMAFLTSFNVAPYSMRAR